MADQSQGTKPVPTFTEAPFSANMFLNHPSGINIQFTIRTQTAQEGITNVGKLIAILTDAGYTAGENRGGGGGGAAAGKKDAEGGTSEQVMIGFRRIEKDDDVSYELPFLLYNGQEAEYPKVITPGNKKARELLEVALRAAGIDPAAKVGRLVKCNLVGTWRQGALMKKKNPADPDKHYVDWLSFAVAPLAGDPRDDGTDRGDEIPF